LEEKWSASFRSSRRTCWGLRKGEGMVGGGIPTAAEVAAGEGVPGEEKG
jgi:hypothetical protein